LHIPGWNSLVQLITDGLLFFQGLTGSTALAIILFTIIIKLIVLPLSLPALRNSRKQQQIAPLIKQIYKKHGKDRAAISAETMALYQQYGINPMSGCLPLLIQFPIFLALWQAIMHLSTGNNVGGLLWIDNLARPDHILPFLAALAQWLQTRMAIQPKDQIIDPQQRSMNTIMQIMPLMVIFIGWNIAAGAVLYWFVSSLFSAVQQYFVTGWGSLVDMFPFLPRKKFPPLEPIKPKEGQPARKSFMQRMQEKALEMQQQQQKLQAQTAAASNASSGSTNRSANEEIIQEAEFHSGIRFTDDAWGLPGAPGTSGSSALAALDAPSKPQQSNKAKKPESKKKKRR